jgi:hypothetical protein
VLFLLRKIKSKGEATMNMEKFTNKLLNAKELKDIPVEYIFKVAFFILELLKDKEVFYEMQGGI